jgi:Raf kinase inhibitor-like YbhB/YbcL family protein
MPNGRGGAKASDDISPPLAWSGAPTGTKSFAVVVTDPDIPDVSNFNVKNTVIKKSAKRVTGYHWTLVNIPVTTTSLPVAAGGKGFVAGGKAPGITPYGLTGINVYNAAFKSSMAERINFHNMTPTQLDGLYGDYDGPCSAWNDEAVHHYTYTVYALNIAKLKLPSNGHFHGKQVMTAMKGHVLAHAAVVGLFSTNPPVMEKLGITKADFYLGKKVPASTAKKTTSSKTSATKSATASTTKSTSSKTKATSSSSSTKAESAS